MKLKTLIDICEDKWCGTKNGIPDCKRCKRLKKEAIKWVKSKKQYWPSTDNWIKMFFNITEDDLK